MHGVDLLRTLAQEWESVQRRRVVRDEIRKAESLIDRLNQSEREEYREKIEKIKEIARSKGLEP